MADPNVIGDDEVLLRRLPPGATWLKEPGPVPTSLTVRLRPGESSLSVSRQSMTTPRRLLELADATPGDGWRVMAARASDLRAFGLLVRPDPTTEDPGHAALEPSGLDLTDKQVCRRLVRLFTLLPEDLSPPPSE